MAVDLDLEQEWVSSFRRKVETLELRKQHPDVPCTIFRVPPKLRDLDPDAYDPKIVSFGPYHRNIKPSLSYMEQFKMLHLQKILGRNRNVGLDDYLKRIKEREAHARASYSEDIIDMDNNAFVEMMLLDGAFFVELFLMSTDGKHEQDDPLVTDHMTLPMIKCDMLKLENQIPFFILECIFELATCANAAIGLNTLLRLFFKYRVSTYEKMTVSTESLVPKLYHHLLHFLHCCLMPENYPQSSQPQIRTRWFYKPCTLWMSSVFSYLRGKRQAEDSDTDSTPPLQSVPCATKLQLAGVKFQGRKDKSFLDVTFHDGTMEIPALEVYEETSSILRNLIAFEQRFPEVGAHVTTYASFMDRLIDTGNDVALLHQHSCIVNALGNHDEAAKLFNSVVKNAYFDYESHYLSGLVKDVKKHYDSRCNKWRAKLMSDYFGNPWSVLSLFGAIILIWLTVIQSVFAVFTYFRPPR